ncbi:hypothetical protein H4Q26_002839 [Puccinia striiformis f. sp. tritici PST-130]|nr:hypothetical protein H4Q26_002839 [Puccinia striiformis f. sp. tritici PST-130]
MGFLFNCHRWLLCFPVAYVVFILSLGIPYIQRGAIYLHWVRFPIQANFDAPEFYGIAPGQVRNFQLTTPDGAKIGVWHALPEAVYVRHFQQSANSSASFLQSYTGPIPMSVFEGALRWDEVTYESKNGFPLEVRGLPSCRSFSGSTYGACDEGLNFVIYDYRGFADSSPSTFRNYLRTYSLFKFIPILQPLSIFPRVQSWLLDTLLATHFNTKSLIPSITTNIMLIHAQDDIDVHPSHSKFLFEHIHEHHSTNVTGSDINDLPILLPSSHKQSHLSRTPIRTSSDHRLKPVITTHEIPNFGTIRQFSRLHSRTQVTFLDAQRGGHNQVGYSGTALRAMVEMICKPSP